jgi:hypothetical protein
MIFPEPHAAALAWRRYATDAMAAAVTKIIVR